MGNRDDNVIMALNKGPRLGRQAPLQSRAIPQLIPPATTAGAAGVWGPAPAPWPGIPAGAPAGGGRHRPVFVAPKKSNTKSEASAWHRPVTPQGDFNLNRRSV